MPKTTQGPLTTTTHTTDAEWRAQAQLVHDTVVGAGLVQTADTGQLDIATTARPTLASEMKGYRIYKWTDPLDGEEIFLKLEFGNSATAGRFGMASTFGLGSDGAGNLTQATTRLANLVGNATTGGTLYGCSSSGGFWVSMPNGTTSSWILGAMRPRDSAAGSPASQLIVIESFSSGFQGYVWNPATLTWSVPTQFGGMFISLGSAIHPGGNATDVSMAPGLFYESGFLRYVDVVVADPDDVTHAVPFTIDMPEGTRTFFPIKGLYPSSTLNIYCFLWED